MIDREKIMSWLEGLAQQDWRMFHSDSEVQVIAEHALALLKEQEAEIAFLKAMQLQTVHNMSNEDIGNAVRNVLRL